MRQAKYEIRIIEPAFLSSPPYLLIWIIIAVAAGAAASSMSKLHRRGYWSGSGEK